MGSILDIIVKTVSYDPNAEVRTRYRSDVYSEQCVQSKHREITNYYINITVAFIAYSISDLVFLEGQSLYTNTLSYQESCDSGQKPGPSRGKAENGRKARIWSNMVSLKYRKVWRPVLKTE